MWNPFRRVTLQPVIPDTDPILPYKKGNLDTVIKAEVDRLRQRSLLARTQASMVYETLAASSLAEFKGESACPD